MLHKATGTLHPHTHTHTRNGTSRILKDLNNNIQVCVCVCVLDSVHKIKDILNMSQSLYTAGSPNSLCYLPRRYVLGESI